MDTDIMTDILEEINDIKKYALNEDGARILRITKALERNHKKFGAAYCPCKVDKIPENICPCYDFTDTGICKCGLYQNVIKEE
jgi:ferredoxin-thioredoxin reductase catalytic subunit